MIYSKNTNPWACTCGEGYISAADSCVSEKDKSNLDVGFSLVDARSITYYSVKNTNNEDNLETTTLAYSDIFNHYYLYAAIGCQVEKNPRKCQILANLCVL